LLSFEGRALVHGPANYKPGSHKKKRHVGGAEDAPKHAAALPRRSFISVISGDFLHRTHEIFLATALHFCLENQNGPFCLSDSTPGTLTVPLNGIPADFRLEGIFLDFQGGDLGDGKSAVK
jgi:hypothetical protein